MAELNQITLIGYAGTDIQVRSTATGTRVGNFTIATTSFYQTQNGERSEQTTWHRITVWGNGLIDMLQKHGPKGKRIMVTGELRQDNYASDKGDKFLTLSVTLTPSSVISFVDASQFQKQDQPIPQPA